MSMSTENLLHHEYEYWGSVSLISTHEYMNTVRLIEGRGAIGTNGYRYYPYGLVSVSTERAT